MKTLRNCLLVVGSVLLLLFVGCLVFYYWSFPYGWSHSCDLILSQALFAYAEEHGGAFPAGEATPEASLSLLYPKYANERALQGRTVPLETVGRILQDGERLGPNSCGWHYVEGLRLGDDPRLALFWDKVPLGHNGQRNSDGGHRVFFVRAVMDHQYIPGAEWEQFLDEQARLFAARHEKERK
jgi:hypothetical protein